MFENIPQVQSAPISQFKQTHFVGLMTYTKEQFAAFFTTENPAPVKLAAQLTVFNQKYDVLDEAYRIDSYSLDTEKLKKADEDCDSTVKAINKMIAAQQAFGFNPPVKDAADRMMQCYDKFEIDVTEDYLGENNKLQQFVHEIETSAQLTADAQTLGIQPAVAQLKEKVTLMRDLLTQRGLAQAPKGAMKAARATMETEYRWLIAALNAYTFVDENPQRFASLISILNTNIDYLRIHALKDGGNTSGQGGNGSDTENSQNNQGGQGGQNTQTGDNTGNNGQQTGDNTGDNTGNTGNDTPGGDNTGDDNNDTPPGGGDINDGGLDD